ncbi:MAG: inositol monophosphatase family protein [Verrucomicrobia bacterium]|nr:inositol monophosphatase family protein [Verrucomicrobiota bacterium]
MEPDSFIPFVNELLTASGKIVKPYFFNRDYSIDRKPDESPVTKADKEAEECIRTLIQREFPHHGIIGEEFGKENEDSEFTWVIDPIDGTDAFITGSPLFTTLVGLLHNDEPILGAIHQPIAGLRCIGNNTTTTLNGKNVSCRETSSLEEATVLASSITTADQYQNGERFNDIVQQARLFRTWGDGYGYLLVASGQADVMLDPIVNPWDVLPVIPVIRGSGATIGNWQGGEDHWESCVASTPALFETVIGRLNGV